MHGHEPIIVDLRRGAKGASAVKIEKVMDYEWLYERLDPYYCHDNLLVPYASGCAL